MSILRSVQVGLPHPYGEGELECGEAISLVDRPYPQWWIQRAKNHLYQTTIDAVALAELFLLPVLSSSWKQSLG